MRIFKKKTGTKRHDFIKAGDVMMEKETSNSPSVDYAAIGNRVRQLRNKLKMSIPDFVEKIYPDGTKSIDYYGKQERNEKGKAFQIEDLVKISCACDVSLDWLITGDTFKASPVENYRFTLREICAALTQAIFLCDATVTPTKDNNGQSVILCSFPVYLLDPPTEENLSFETITRFLSAFSSVISLDKSHDIFVCESGFGNLARVQALGGTIGIGTSKLEGLPNTNKARQLLEEYLQIIPSLTPYAYFFSETLDQYRFPVPNSLREHIELAEEYYKALDKKQNKL